MAPGTDSSAALTCPQAKGLKQWSIAWYQRSASVKRSAHLKPHVLGLLLSYIYDAMNFVLTSTSFVYSAIKGSVDPQGLCKGYDAGGFTTTKCGDNSHDYSHLLLDPPTRPVVIKNRKRCATECPDADGQIQTARNGEVRHTLEHMVTTSTR